MKKSILIIFILLIAALQQKAFSYCIPTTAPYNFDYIGNVSLKGVSNNSYSEGYHDYTSLSACTLSTCQTDTLSVYHQLDISAHPRAHTNGTNSMMVNHYYLAAWIDYNNNNIFDANEKLGEILADTSLGIYGATFNIYFNVPSNVSNGLKRMRVMLGDTASPGGLNPCGILYGDVEDYSVFINLTYPIPGLTTNSPVCTGNNLNLNAGGGASYSWTGPNSFYSYVQNPVINSAAPIVAGTYYVTVTGSNYCVTTSSTTVVINNNPSPVIGSNSPVCSGNDLNLNSSGGTGYSWTGPNIFSSTQQNPVINSAGTAATGNYFVTVTNASGCTASTSTSVNVPVSPTVSQGSNSPICAGKTLSLNSGGGTSYAWTGPNSFSSALQNPSLTNITSLAAGSYTVTVTDLYGCTATSAINITVKNKPPAASISNTPVCTGKNLTLSASGGTSYAWYGPNTFYSTLQSPTVTGVGSNSGGNYTVIVTGANGCTSTSSQIVAISSPPSIAPSYNNPVCIGTPLQLNCSGGVSYSWTGPGGFTSNIQNPYIPVTTTNTAGSYVVVGTDANGCSSSSSVSVSIRSNPVANAGSNASVCLRSNATLHATGGTTYSWTGPNGFTATTQNAVITGATSVNAGPYTVSVTNSFGCHSTNSSAATLTIIQLPVVTMAITGPACIGSNVNLNATGGTTYAWTGPHSFTSSSQNPVINNSSSLDNGFYYVSVYDGTCTAHDSLNVTINPLPVISASGNNPVCNGSSLQLTVANAAQSYSWTGPNSFTSALQNPLIAAVTFIDSGNYAVTVTDLNGCVDDTSVYIQVVASPIIVTTNSGPVCDGDSLLLTASGGGTYSWAGPNGFTSSLQNPVILNASLPAAGIYSVTVSLAGGCSSSQNDTVVVNSRPVISATNSGPVCSGGQINFNTTGGNSYLWFGPGGFTSVIGNPSIQITTIADSGLYIVVGTNDTTGCSFGDTTQVIILENPSVGLGNDTLACPGSLKLIAGNPGATYLWNDSTTNDTLVVSTAGTYSVLVTAANGCFDSDTINVTLNSLPVISLNLSLDTVCNYNGEQFLYGGLPAGGFYSGTGVSGISFDPDIAGLGNHIIIYGITDSITGCSNSATDTLFVSDCVGIEELNNSIFYSVYPNPFNSLLTIENHQSNSKMKIDLMTVDARLIRSWNFNNQSKYTLALDDLSAGVYFLLLRSEDGTGFFRVTKE